MIIISAFFFAISGFISIFALELLAIMLKFFCERFDYRNNIFATSK